MQITIQQPRNVTEMQPRPTVLPQQIPKQIAGSQPLLQHTQVAQAQKVIMTQAGASPVIQAAPTTTTLSAAKLSKDNIQHKMIPRLILILLLADLTLSLLKFWLYSPIEK